MNTQKLNFVLGGVFVLLTILSIVKFVGSSQNFVDTAELERLVPGFTPQNVHIVQLTRGGQKEGEQQQNDPKSATVQITFQKDGEEWRLIAQEFGGQPLKALGSMVEDRILKKIEKLQVSESTLIVERADDATLREKGFGEDSWTIVCMDASAKELCKIEIGREAGREGDDAQTKVRGTYVKRADQESILQSEESFDLPEKLGDWLDKSVLSVDEGEVSRIHLMNDKGEILLERVEPAKKEGDDTGSEPAGDTPKATWKVVRGPEDVGKLRDYEVSTLLARATNLSAKEFLQPATQQGAMQAGLLQPSIRVELTLSDEQKTRKVIRIGKRVEGEQAYQALVDGGRMIFSLADWDVTPFEKAPQDFFDAKPEPKKPEPKETGEPGEVPPDKEPGAVPDEEPGKKTPGEQPEKKNGGGE